MNLLNRLRVFVLFMPLIGLTACTTINIDHIQLEDSLALENGDSVVILGRHNSAELETEASLVTCIGQKLQGKTKHIVVISEKEFVDALYPWFEPRTAPLHPKKLGHLLNKFGVADKLTGLKIRYFIWVEGSTERTNVGGSLGCAVGPGGGGCFGFGTWEDTSDYETVIWELAGLKEVGRISTEAVGRSYMPAFIIPIPLLARVEGDACEGMANQLAKFFVDDKPQLKRLP